MKYLSNYLKEGQTKVTETAGAFWAFGDKQFGEQKVNGIKYLSMGNGLICPKENCDKLAKDLINVYKEGIKQDIKENGITSIIKRELENHEVCITQDISDTVEALKDYNITTKDIINVFNNL